jgi:hypothetical protein
MTSLMAAAEARAQAITNAGDAVAYTDERKALANRPCLLFGPPTLDYSGTAGGTLCGPAVSWQLFALSTMNAPAFEAMTELQDLIEAADDVLGIVRAEPIAYPTRDAKGAAGRPLAAYRLTTTDYPLD